MTEPLDPSLNFLFRTHSVLNKIFSPKTIAVIGATEKEGSVGRTVMSNLLGASFEGEIFPVNPKRLSVLGVKTYPSVASIPKQIDLAVVVTPASAIPQLISDCVDAKIPAAVIISAGFKEMGVLGTQLEEQILAHARRGGMRVIGPNCLGVMRPCAKLNATFAADMAKEGSIAFISQSGALCTAVLDWSLHEQVGFSAFVSIGSMIDVNWGDLINYFGEDEETKSILIYMESIGDARAFISAAREVARSKPIILIRAGRSAESAKAAASHTGSLSGSDEVLSAALRRAGVLRVDSISELFSMADFLAKQPMPKGPDLTIVTNAGGPGVIATDALVQHGGRLTKLSFATLERYNSFLPAPWSHNNPVDILGDASAEIYAQALEVAVQDPHAHGVLVILTPQDMTDSTQTAARLSSYAKSTIPVLASWMGADSVAEGKKILNQAGIPTFSFPDDACKAFAGAWNFSEQLRLLYEVPQLASEWSDETRCGIRRHRVEQMIQKVLAEGRTLLDEVESKKLLEAYGIPTVSTAVALNAEQAVELARGFGFPVVLKLYSHTITHKTDVGGVKLNLKNEAEVRASFEAIHSSVKEVDFQGVTVQPMIKLEGYELIIGSSVDEEFGPVLLFGSGGQLVEVFKDRSLALPPLTSTLARRLMERTKIYDALQGVRGRKSIDLKQLEQLLVQFSNLIVEHPRIKECDINPLLASADQLIALDARIILHPESLSDQQLPKPAIRPYPSSLVQEHTLKEGTKLIFRPIRPEDEPRILEFHKDLSQETVRARWFKDLKFQDRVNHERLSRICFIDYDREIVLIAERVSNKEILGLGRLSKIPAAQDALFGLVVKDEWQNKGIGSRLIDLILLAGKQEKIKSIYASMLVENKQMRNLCLSKGFACSRNQGMIFAQINLGTGPN